MDTKSRIFELLDKKGMEQKSFAEAVGVSADTVSNWRRGVSNSYNRYLVKIAQVLGTTTADLLGEEKKNSPPSDDDELREMLSCLFPEEKRNMMDYARFLISQRDEP